MLGKFEPENIFHLRVRQSSWISEPKAEATDHLDVDLEPVWALPVLIFLSQGESLSGTIGASYLSSHIRCSVHELFVTTSARKRTTTSDNMYLQGLEKMLACGIGRALVFDSMPREIGKLKIRILAVVKIDRGTRGGWLHIMRGDGRRGNDGRMGVCVDSTRAMGRRGVVRNGSLPLGQVLLLMCLCTTSYMLVKYDVGLVGEAH